VRATWWQEKQDEVVDRSQCRVAAHDRSLHAGFVAVHHKTSSYLVEPQNLDRKLRCRRTRGGIRAHREASMPANTWWDCKAYIGRTRTTAKVWPCDEEECYMTYLPLRGLYNNLSARGSLVICSTQKDSYILTLGFLGKPFFRTASHFFAPQAQIFFTSL
jgi:hypothetical protein